MFQDILKFAKSSKDKGFRIQELANWLVRHNHEFVETYAGSRMRKSAIVQNVLQRVERNVMLLRDMSLVIPKNIASAEKNRVQIYLYGLTEEGNFIALLVEYHYTQSAERKKVISDEVYKLCISSLEKREGAKALFLLQLFKAFEKKELFPGLIHSATTLIAANPIFRPLDSFMSIDNPLLWIIFAKDAVIEVLSTTDEDVKCKVLMHFKAHIEEYFRADPGTTAEWESVWLGARNDESKIVTEGRCLQCSKRQPIILDIIKDIVILAKLLIPNNFPVYAQVECTGCKKPSKIPIFPLVPRTSFK